MGRDALVCDKPTLGECRRYLYTPPSSTRHRSFTYLRSPFAASLLPTAYLLQACTADIIYCFDDGAGRAVYEVHYAPELLFQLRGKAKRVGLPIDHMEIGASTQETFPTNKQQHQRGRLCASSQRHLYHCSAELPRQ